MTISLAKDFAGRCAHSGLRFSALQIVRFAPNHRIQWIKPNSFPVGSVLTCSRLYNGLEMRCGLGLKTAQIIRPLEGCCAQHIELYDNPLP